MATRTPTKLLKESRYDVWEWTGLLNTDVGAPVNLADHADVTFKVYGTFGAGGEVTMLGSLNLPGTTTDAGTALEEEAGTPLVLNTTDRWGTPRNAALQAWPSVTNGDGTTSLTVRAVIRR